MWFPLPFPLQVLAPLPRRAESPDHGAGTTDEGEAAQTNPMPSQASPVAKASDVLAPLPRRPASRDIDYAADSTPAKPANHLIGFFNGDKGLLRRGALGVQSDDGSEDEDIINGTPPQPRPPRTHTHTRVLLLHAVCR